jgi:hypothetical protein
MVVIMSLRLIAAFRSAGEEHSSSMDIADCAFHKQGIHAPHFGGRMNAQECLSALFEAPL